ncbi:MAG: hypothetical protein IT431_06345 [Phycisphaerales bacterium]|nr:hypothetical protein [Phycisphaerales bacterium]
MTVASDAATPMPLEFHWEPQPEAQGLIDGLIADFLGRCPRAAALAERMRLETGTRFKDWVDFIEVADDPAIRRRLLETGFTAEPQPGAPGCFVHKGAIFPAVVLGPGGPVRVGIKTDSLADVCAANLVDNTMQAAGEAGSRFRWGQVFVASGERPGAELWAVERHGYRGFAPVEDPLAVRLEAQRQFERLRRRQRDFPTDEQGFTRLHELLDEAIAVVGVDWACDLFFAAEREYWMRRNRAARAQKSRQDVLGLGWANHDHHTFRCSRENYTRVIATLEKLGFGLRERFYAGREAGWGAQVLEQPVTGITIFADVDMEAEELSGDFAHTALPERDELGTIGLWVALHGESMLQAGMHHLECQFDWHALREQLLREGVNTMQPFTTFSYLRQAFTEGEWWRVDEGRLARLVAKGQLSPDQAAFIRENGTIGSHLENLERNDGFKGFNQQGVSDIIQRTDARRHLHPTGA